MSKPPEPSTSSPPPQFIWSTGEEGSDPWVLKDGSKVRMDQFACSDHLKRQASDLADVASLGVKLFRYGMPWRLAEPAPGQYDWTLWDQAFDACAAAGLEPVVDLLHFGLPDDCAGFAEPSWVPRFIAYTKAFLARYRQPRYFTPVNEPAFTAMASAYFGLWNDRLSSEADFARTLSHVVLANLEALAAIHADREAWWLGAEAFSVPVATSDETHAEVEKRRARSWLVWDLHFGLEPLPEAQNMLRAIEPDILKRIRALTLKDRLIAGHDVYPVGIQRLGDEGNPPGIEQRLRLYEAEAQRWYARYRQPFWISETSNLSLPIAQQEAWLAGWVDCIGRMHGNGLPLRGLCWYSRGDQYDWDTALNNPTGAVTEVGLFDAQRGRRPVAGLFEQLAKSDTFNH